VRSAPKTALGKRKVRLRNGRPLPQADPDTELGIIEAYKAICGDKSTDYILCDPEWNAEFVSACRKRSLPGDAFVWNRLLLRIRKQGRLPKGHESPRRLTFALMDGYSAAAEVATHLLGLDYALGLDDILCSPNAAAEFDRIAADFAPGYSPWEYRWAALAIRKRRRKSQKLANAQFLDWLRKDLPAPIPLSECAGEQYEQSGVYVVYTREGEPLYVGETLNIRGRVVQVRGTQRWMELNPTLLMLIPSHNYRLQHGLQSILIRRTRPLLNGQRLRQKRDQSVCRARVTS
jgi:site-specific DNA-methyltransferase (adenine-specific)